MDLDQLSETIKSAGSGVAADIIAVLPVLLRVLTVVVIAIFAARFAKRQVTSNLARTAINRNVVILTANLALAGVWVVAISAMLAILGASWSGLLTLLGAGTITVGLSLQDLLRNYVAGIYLLLERPFAIGDRVRIRDVDGLVESVELRTTILSNDAGEQITVPNATVFLEIVTNRSISPDEATTVVLSKLDLPLADIPQLVTTTLAELTGDVGRPPKVSLVGASAEGATVSATLFHPPGADLTAGMLARLRERFPAADVAVERGS